jgi:hypothetical protein
MTSQVQVAPDRVSGASPHKSGRPVSPTTIRLAETLTDVLATEYPMSTRGAFYAATVAGAVPKTEGGYRKVQRLLVQMRERREIPWSWIVDGTRWRRGVNTYDGVDDALRRTAALYRRSLWDRSDEVVEVWLEKEALAGVVYPITSQWTVDLMVCRGYPSLSYLHQAAEETIFLGGGVVALAAVLAVAAVGVFAVTFAPVLPKLNELPRIGAPRVSVNVSLPQLSGLTLLRIGAIDECLVCVVIVNAGPGRVENVTLNAFVDGAVQITASDPEGNPEKRGVAMTPIVEDGRRMNVWVEREAPLPVRATVLYYLLSFPEPEAVGDRFLIRIRYSAEAPVRPRGPDM